MGAQIRQSFGEITGRAWKKAAPEGAGGIAMVRFPLPRVVIARPP
ncbi:MAG: hypothetical protein ACO2YP_11240 [Pseudomonadales bacterium]